MEGMDIVKILGVGLSGFGFLLMFLAYRLIRSIIALPHTNPLVVKTINRYMLVCFVMTIAVGVFTFITTLYKQDVITNQQAKIDNGSKALNILAASNNNSLIADSIARNAGNNQKVFIVKQEQKKLLDTLSNYIVQQDNPKLTEDFNKYKTLALKASDSLGMPGLTKSEIDTLRINFLKYTNSISKLSLNTAMSVSQ
ncbi:MAG: hypothetical protein QM802_26535 [Agriterribacter sp.]